MRSETNTERAIRRRLAILVLLHIGPQSFNEILADLERKDLFRQDHALDPTTIARRQRFQLKQDIEALRLLGYDLLYDSELKHYTWQNSPFGLSLTPSQLASLALLLGNFRSLTIPHAAEIADLLTFLADHLPSDQQKQLNKQRPPLHIDLQETTGYRDADPDTVKKIEQAIQQGQQLEFTYRSRDGQERRHVIEPRPLVFRQGHVYLYGWSVDWNKDLPFRLDYIQPGTVHILSNSIKERPFPRSYTLRYQLSALVARDRVSKHFPDQDVEYHEDGSATVTARITDLFDTAQILFRYREHCLVLDPPELVEQMRTSIAKMYANYHTQA